MYTKTGWPAPRLKDVQLSAKKMADTYWRCLGCVSWVFYMYMYMRAHGPVERLRWVDGARCVPPSPASHIYTPTQTATCAASTIAAGSCTGTCRSITCSTTRGSSSSSTSPRLVLGHKWVWIDVCTLLTQRTQPRRQMSPASLRQSKLTQTYMHSNRPTDSR